MSVTKFYPGTDEAKIMLTVKEAHAFVRAAVDVPQLWSAAAVILQEKFALPSGTGRQLLREAAEERSEQMSNLDRARVWLNG